MSDKNLNRRATDKMPLDIEQMIIAESDPRQRAFLIVLTSINTSLAANTKTVKEVSEKLEAHLARFDTHASREESIYNRWRGAWKVIAYVMGALQIAAIGVWQGARADLKEIQSAIRVGQEQHADFEHRLRSLEAPR